jgi:hypothetical protein
LANINQANIIVKKTNVYLEKKSQDVKKIISSINKNFNIENLTIGIISFDFNIEIPHNDDFKFPSNIANYNPSDDANALVMLNEVIWLYLSYKKNFHEKLKQFNHFIQMAEAHKEYVLLYPAYHEIHIELLNEIISKSDCEENNFEEYQTLFYSQYGIDLKEYLDKKIFHEESDFQKTYQEYQIYTNKYKMLRNITHLDNTNNKKIIFNINSSKPIHKLIKSYSSYIEINPLMTRKEVQNLVKQYYQICSEATELLKLFDKEARSSEYNDIDTNHPTYDLKSNTPSSKSGEIIIKKSMIIAMIMEHYQIDDTETAIRYFNYYWMKENYQSLQFESKPLFDILNDNKCSHLTGIITLRKNNKFNTIESGPTKRSIIKLIKLLKHSL